MRVFCTTRRESHWNKNLALVNAYLLCNTKYRRLGIGNDTRGRAWSFDGDRKGTVQGERSLFTFVLANCGVDGSGCHRHRLPGGSDDLLAGFRPRIFTARAGDRIAATAETNTSPSFGGPIAKSSKRDRGTGQASHQTARTIGD